LAPWGRANTIDENNKLMHKEDVTYLKGFKEDPALKMRKINKYKVDMEFRSCWEALAWFFGRGKEVGSDCLCAQRHIGINGFPKKSAGAQSP
jgi:hypothetical protein